MQGHLRGAFVSVASFLSTEEAQAILPSVGFRGTELVIPFHFVSPAFLLNCLVSCLVSIQALFKGNLASLVLTFALIILVPLLVVRLEHLLY